MTILQSAEIVPPYTTDPLDSRAIHSSISRPAHDSHSSFGKHLTIVVPSSPLDIKFRSVKWLEGIRSAVLSVAALGVAASLATHITTPALQGKFLFVSLVSLVFGLALIPSALANLFGGLRLDSRGVHVRTGLTSTTIPWNELRSWRFSGSQLQVAGNACVRPQMVCLSKIKPEDRLSLRDVLGSCAPEKERRAGDTEPVG